MAAGAVIVYGAAIEAIAKGLIDLDNDTFVLTLHSASYTPSADVDDAWEDVSASQFSTAGGYTDGGVALSSVTVNRSGGTTTFDAADISWPSSTLSGVKWGIITKRAGGSLVNADRLLAYFELESGGTVSTTNGTLAVNWNASGIFTLARA